MPQSIVLRSHAASADATIRIAVPRHLCTLQTETRNLCRAVGLDEPGVFQAVIAVTELAHRLFVECPRAGDVALYAVRRGIRLSLSVVAAGVDGRGAPPVRVRLLFPLVTTSPYS